MDFKSMLNQLSQLSEATKETSTGKVHKAEPGGYGRKFDTDEEGDEKKEKKPEVKRGRGRPKKGADSDTGEVKTYGGAKELQSYMIGNLPKGKLPGKASKKHSLKEWVQEIEEKYVAEAEQVTIQPAQQNTQVIKQGTKTLGTVTNPQLAAQIKQSIGKGEMTLAGDHKLGEGDEDYSAKKARAGKDIGKPGKQFAKIAKAAGEKYGSKERGEKVAGAVLAKLRAKTNEGDIPSSSSIDTIGAGLGAGRSQTTLEAAKPDFIDLDKDGNKKESMKKAADDAKKDKKKVNESMHKHTAARLLGKHHALAKEAYNCKYEDMEEARQYHEGFKEGLDECYGQQPIVGLVKETPPATVPGMASQAMPAMEDDMYEMDKSEWMKHKAKTTPGDTFKAFGQTMKDKDVLEMDSMAFESLDKQLNALLTEGEQVDEGMTVSISKGQQGMPDSVSVSAQDGEAEQLLGLIKQAGLGLFGGEESNGYGAPQGDTPQHGGVDVVGDHDGMMALIKKVTGGEPSNGDYADEEGSEEHDHEHSDEETCNECGYMESKCECDKEMVDEVESEDQMTYEVAEDNAPDSDEAETAADENAEAQEDEALAKADSLKEWANQTGSGPGKGTDASFEQDIEFMTKVIAGGLNKPKSTGQTTIPVIAGQDTRMEDPMAWARLAGIKK